jgi:hypothetical protein
MRHVTRLRRPSADNGDGSDDGRAEPRVISAPQSKQEAARKGGMFLYTDDAWSLRYYRQGDLHFLERQLFGRGR